MMKGIGLIFLFCPLLATSQLLNDNEVIVFSFKTYEEKTVTLSKDQGDEYMVFRIMVKDKVEFETPEKLDSNSWFDFTYEYAYIPSNESQGKDKNQLSFRNNGNLYVVYENYFPGSDSMQVGMRVKNDDWAEPKVIHGIESSMKGSLKQLKNNYKIERFELNDW